MVKNTKGALVESAESVKNDKINPLGNIVVLDDEPSFARIVSRILARAGFKVTFFNRPSLLEEFLAREDSVDVVITDMAMPEMDGIELCRRIKVSHPDIEVIVMTGVGSIKTAVEAMKAGAYDYLTKPFESDEVIKMIVSNAIERRRLLRRTRYLEKQVDIRTRFENIVGGSKGMLELFKNIEYVAPTDTTVLIYGESGTGKELVARAVHERSRRRNKPFLPVNCSALTQTLLESELFGHVRGAFTGATHRKRGLFEEADGGSIFMDEVEEMSPAMQVKLLRVLQEGEVRPIGGNEIRKVDVRVIAATNVDLKKLVSEGKFREDLYYRIKVFTVHIPPLRERAEDIPILAYYFMRKYAAKMGKNVTSIDSRVMARLMSHRWPGNVRELEHVIERAVVLASSDTLTLDTLPSEIVSFSDPNPDPSTVSEFTLKYQEAKERAIAAFDRRYLEAVLTRANGVIAEAARQAGVDRSNFRKLMHRYGLDAAAFRAREAGG